LIRVAISDDQAMVRAGFRMIVESQKDMQVAGEAADGQEAIDLVRRERPDVVLMDIRMPRVDGIEATRQVAASRASSSSPPSSWMSTSSTRWPPGVGVSPQGGATRRPAPRYPVVAAGDALLAPSVTKRLIEEFAKRPEPASRKPKELATLTEREREVLQQVAGGFTNAEIAQRLHVSETTVKTHVAHLLDKLGLRDRVQAVILAYEAGLVG